MLSLKRAYDNGIIIVRGIAIQEQIDAKLPDETNGVGGITINLSQDTQQMLGTDITSLTELQQKQNDNVVVIHDSMENKMNEQVLRLRELHKMIGNDVSLMTEFDTNFKDLINKISSNEGGCSIGGSPNSASSRSSRGSRSGKLSSG